LTGCVQNLQCTSPGSKLRPKKRRHRWPKPSKPLSFLPDPIFVQDGDNESDENVIESVTLIFDFFELVQ